MAGFNTRNQNAGKNGFKPTVNHEGTVVHQLDAIETLFSKVLGSFFAEGTHYESKDADKEFANLVKLIESVPLSDKEYALKIAELGRLSNMISFPLQVLSAAYHLDRYKGENFLDDKRRNKLGYYTDVIVRRTKDINQILATHFAVYGRDHSLPKQMRKHLTAKLESYDKYKLSKGLDESSEVTLADAIKLLHPKNEALGQFYKDIIENNVVLGNDKKQIQTELTRMGQNKTSDTGNRELKKATTVANVDALIRNLVNLYKNDVFADSQVLQDAVRKLKDKKAVLASRLLPFRFLAAYRELSKFGNNQITVSLKEALEDAMDLSVENVDTIDGTTAVLIDRSWSMVNSKLSKESSMTLEDVAMLLGAIAYKRGVGDLFIFSDRCVRIDVSRRTPVLEIVNTMKKIRQGMESGTDLKLALDTIAAHATQNNVFYDNLIILSDNDCYGYNASTNTLSFGERSYAYGNRSTKAPADVQVNHMIAEGIIKKVWLNNLGGNDFAVVNTNAHTKNLITGFSEKFVNMINVYNYFGAGKDIRKVIDALLEKERAAFAGKRSND